MSQTLVFIGLLTICIPKYVPVPIFIPLYLIALGAAIYVAQKGMQRNVVIALVAFQFAPLALMRERSLADVQSWGMKGTYGAGAPMKGVYLFDGLPLSIVDWSHCIWYEQGKTAYCHLPNVIGLWPSGVNAAAAGFIPTADLGSGGPTQEELAVTPPWPLLAMFYHVALHNRLDFYFNDALTEAQVYENVCLAATASPSPLAFFFPYGLCTTASVYQLFRASTMVKDGASPPTWYRNTYFQEQSDLQHLYDSVMVADKRRRAGGTAYPAKMKFGDGYKLIPLLTPESNGKPKLHSGNLAKALKLSDKIYIRDM
jgi:hypothetical protein